MPTPVTVSFPATQLIFFWKFRQMGLLVNDGSSQSIPHAFLLRDESDVSHYVKMHFDGSRALSVSYADKPTGSYQDFFLDDDAGYLSFMRCVAGGEPAADSIVVGTGDIRHVYGAETYSKLHRFKFGTSESDALVITCLDDYCIRIYYTVAAGYTTIDIPQGIIVNPS